VVGTSPYAFQVGKIEFNEFEAPTVGRSVLSHLLSRGFGFVKIPCCDDNVRTVSGQRPRSFHAEAGRSTSDEDPFGPSNPRWTKRHLWSKLHQMKLPQACSPFFTSLYRYVRCDGSWNPVMR
jgi:hypothetical protein